MSDLLRLDYINSLPQPFVATFYGGDEWPVHDIDVETGLLRIDVCGKLQAEHIGGIKSFTDIAGVIHDSESFYCDCEPELTKRQEIRSELIQRRNWNETLHDWAWHCLADYFTHE